MLNMDITPIIESHPLVEELAKKVHTDNFHLKAKHVTGLILQEVGVNNISPELLAIIESRVMLWAKIKAAQKLHAAHLESF